jgi:8-oxo-dGTP pyrophosphatase MutT (NUDIX family)
MPAGEETVKTRAAVNKNVVSVLAWAEKCYTAFNDCPWIVTYAVRIGATPPFSRSQATMATASDPIRQAAALPIRNGRICLVTTSNGKRWVIPKGQIEPGQTAGETALQEAWEEAGLVGTIDMEPVGSFLYEKWCGTCHVIVYLMQVTEVARQWPEAALRQRCWLGPTAALARIDDAGLAEIVKLCAGNNLLEKISL